MIETERLIIRKFKESDLKDYFEFVSQVDVLPRVGATPHVSIDTARERLLIEIEKPLMFAIVYKPDNKVVGNIALNNPKPARYEGMDINEHVKEIGYLLSHDYWGKGIMVEAVKGLFNYAFDNLNIEAVVAGVKMANRQSVRVLEKVGLPQHSVIKEYGTWVDGTTTDYSRHRITREEWRALQESKETCQ